MEGDTFFFFFKDSVDRDEGPAAYWRVSHKSLIPGTVCPVLFETSHFPDNSRLSTRGIQIWVWQLEEKTKNKKRSST